MKAHRGVVGIFYLVLAAVITLAVSILIMQAMYNRAANAGKKPTDQGLQGRIVALCTQLTGPDTFDATETVELPSKVDGREVARLVMMYCFPGVSPGDITVENDCSREAPGHVLHWCGSTELLGTKRFSAEMSRDTEFDVRLRVS